mmetsp:Transcript_36969/g.93348  ORF Transcript_36969/g.93348 Transcript_36969/m.93348 type:complete len:329 (-) Transcript_36969:371-1357(-)|eukprot:jgi/Tetstr1/435524/TSEL_024428.t1
MPNGSVNCVEILAAECPGLLRVVTLLAGWLLVARCRLLPGGARLPDLPLPASASEGGVSGWPVVLLCWVGTEVCHDLHGMLRRRVQLAAAEVDRRISVAPGGLYFSQPRVREAYECWEAATPLRRTLHVLAAVMCAVAHIKLATLPECRSLRYQGVPGVRSALVVGTLLGGGRVSSASRSLLGLAAFTYSWASHVSLLAAGDSCYIAICREAYTKSTAAACAMTCVMFLCFWVMCPVSDCHRGFKAASGWVGGVATGYLHMLHRHGALQPAVDEDGRALLSLLRSVLVAALVMYHLASQLSAANMHQFLQFMQSWPRHAQEELLRRRQ